MYVLLRFSAMTQAIGVANFHVCFHEVDQNSPEWFHLRCGMPTSSSFEKIVCGTGEKSKSLLEYGRDLGIDLYKGFHYSAFQGNYYTRRGHELEPLAAEEYALVTSVEPQIIGFVTDDEKKNRFFA